MHPIEGLELLAASGAGREGQQLVPISFGGHCPCLGNDGFDLSKAVELREIGLSCKWEGLVFVLDSSLAMGSWCQ